MKMVLGIGNALVDILISLEDDAFLAEFGLERGSMTRNIIRKGEAPSIKAASSNSLGSVIIKLRHRIRFHADVSMGRIRAQRLPINPSHFMLR